MSFKFLISALTLLLMTGCASVINDKTHPMRVDTADKSGTVIKGAQCKLANDYGVTEVKSGEIAQVRRSSKDLEIVCVQSGQEDAKAKAVSRATGSMWGNILLGGGIGAIVDHNKGTAYGYPAWIQVIFGQALVFDRKDEKEGQMTPPQGQQASPSVTPAAK